MSNTQLQVRMSRKFHRYRQQKTIRDYLKNHSVRKLQLGSGGNPLPGWLNTDIDPSDEMVFLDIRQTFPFGDGTFDFVFSEHSIEHVSYAHGLKCLRECFRVLRPGGKIRITTPNLAFLISLYDENRTEYEQRYIAWSMETFAPPFEVPYATYVINNFFRDWGHQFIYDFKALELAMGQVGFINICAAELGKSNDLAFQGLESHGRVIPPEFNELESMVAEATKPL